MAGKTKSQIKSLKQERRITRSLSEIGLEARKQMASGSVWFAKSDIITDMFQIEAKTKVKPSKSITIKKEWHDKISMEGFEAGKIPVLVYSFGDNNDYFSLEGKDFLALVEELDELRKIVGKGGGK